MNFSFLPGEVKFYDYFERSSQNLLEGARLLVRLLENPENLEEQVALIAEIEHRGDLIVHEVTNLLPRTLITPIDPDEILRLVSAQDDALDAIQEVADRLMIYRITNVKKPAVRLGHLVVEGAQELDQAIKGMRDKRRYEEVRSRVVQVNTIEDNADHVLADGLSSLVQNRGKDLFEFIAWKELYELLEATTDRMEDAGDIIQRVMIANA